MKIIVYIWKYIRKIFSRTNVPSKSVVKSTSRPPFEIISKNGKFYTYYKGHCIKSSETFKEAKEYITYYKESQERNVYKCNS